MRILYHDRSDRYYFLCLLITDKIAKLVTALSIIFDQYYFNLCKLRIIYYLNNLVQMITDYAIESNLKNDLTIQQDVQLDRFITYMNSSFQIVANPMHPFTIANLFEVE